MSTTLWPTGMRETAYQYRAQGSSTREIASRLAVTYPGYTPDHETVRRWLADPDAAATVRRDEARIRAIATVESADLVPLAYAGVRSALEVGDLKGADAGSRVIVNLTRGFIRDQIEVTTAGDDTDHELAALLARNGVSITPEQRVNAVRSSETPSP